MLNKPCILVIRTSPAAQSTTAAVICPASLVSGAIIIMSSLMPVKKRITHEATRYGKKLSLSPAKIHIVVINAPKMAHPPSVGTFP